MEEGGEWMYEGRADREPSTNVIIGLEGRSKEDGGEEWGASAHSGSEKRTRGRSAGPRGEYRP